MGKLGKKFEDLMSAAAFAEMGEFETAKELSEGGSVLLVLRGSEEEEKKTIKFALNISKRIGAGLEVLIVSAKSEAEKVLDYLRGVSEKEGIGLKVQRATGCIKNLIISYTKKRSDIKFVVIESPETLNIDCPERKLQKEWSNIKCPLVMVSEQK